MSDGIAFALSAFYVTSLLVTATVVRSRELLSRRVVRAVVHGAVAAWMIPTALLFESVLWAALLPAIFAGINLFCWFTGRLRAFSAPGEQSLGIVFHPLALAVLIFLFWTPGARSITVCAALVMGWADPLGALVGGAVRSLSFRPLGERKSVAGSAAVFLASLAIVLAVAAVAGEKLGWPAGLVVAAVATLAELVSARGSDNLSVPWAVAATLWLLGWGAAG